MSCGLATGVKPLASSINNHGHGGFSFRLFFQDLPSFTYRYAQVFALKNNKWRRTPVAHTKLADYWPGTAMSRGHPVLGDRVVASRKYSGVMLPRNQTQLPLSAQAIPSLGLAVWLSLGDLFPFPKLQNPCSDCSTKMRAPEQVPGIQCYLQRRAVSLPILKQGPPTLVTCQPCGMSTP